MSLIKIAWRSIRQRALASGMTAFAMGLGVALVVTVLVIHSVIEQSFKRGTIGCNFIVGGKGSQYQLVLNTIFHVEQPLGNIPYKYMEELQNRYSPIIETMVPLCMGHDYKTYPAIATTQDYFDKLTYKDGVKFAFDEGPQFQGRKFLRSRDRLESRAVAGPETRRRDQARRARRNQRQRSARPSRFQDRRHLEAHRHGERSGGVLEHRRFLAMPGA